MDFSSSGTEMQRIGIIRNVVVIQSRNIPGKFLQSCLKELFTDGRTGRRQTSGDHKGYLGTLFPGELKHNKGRKKCLKGNVFYKFVRLFSVEL